MLLSVATFTYVLPEAPASGGLMRVTVKPAPAPVVLPARGPKLETMPLASLPLRSIAPPTRAMAPPLRRAALRQDLGARRQVDEPDGDFGPDDDAALRDPDGYRWRWERDQAWREDDSRGQAYPERERAGLYEAPPPPQPWRRYGPWGY